MSILRDIKNDSLIDLAPELAGLHVQTDFTDTRVRLVSWAFQSAKILDGDRIALVVNRFLNGQHVLDSVTVSAGADSFKRPFPPKTRCWSASPEG